MEGVSTMTSALCEEERDYIDSFGTLFFTTTLTELVHWIVADLLKHHLKRKGVL